MIQEGGPDACDLAPILSRIYESRFSEADLEQMRRVWRVLVRDFFQARIRQDGTILDIGAGPCLFINEVRTARRIALDANPKVASFAAPGVETVVTSDLTLRQFRPGSIDHVFVSNLFEHLPDFLALLRLLSAIRRILAPSGSLLILQPNFRLAGARYFDFVDHSLILTDNSLREALTSAGFDIPESRVRFLPFTSKSAFPKWPFLVALYLRLPPIQWLVGKQTFFLATPTPTKHAAG